jgi:hypothetical protein
VFTTDNGAEVYTWPDGGTTPFAGAKGEVTEGSFRVPALVRWRGHVKPSSVSNGIMSGHGALENSLRETHHQGPSITYEKPSLAQRLMDRVCWTKVRHECPMKSNTVICVRGFGFHDRARRRQDTIATMIDDETQLSILFENGQAPQ